MTESYFCEECQRFVDKAGVLESNCPWCREKRYKHKADGGKVVLKP